MSERASNQHDASQRATRSAHGNGRRKGGRRVCQWLRGGRPSARYKGMCANGNRRTVGVWSGHFRRARIMCPGLSIALSLIRNTPRHARRQPLDQRTAVARLRFDVTVLVLAHGSVAIGERVETEGQAVGVGATRGTAVVDRSIARKLHCLGVRSYPDLCGWVIDDVAWRNGQGCRVCVCVCVGRRVG